ncbi:MAG: sirohydrochlorin cobaltochelatase [Candidatus Methanomethylophilaceae archaeon]|nr:sirohydrochlorin cobaltochelatase [Candidatus Methanomethylophilaceae archaeon]MDY0224218.1 sirohydrochlorin cobaltochelatase [Candidatus Methanomethylophilaceae archaeon]
MPIRYVIVIYVGLYFQLIDMISVSKAILVVSFGTSYNDSRTRTIGAIESMIADKYSDWDVRRAFTSKMIIKKLAERDNERIDYVSDALERLVSDGIKDVIVQPTHIMNGLEYDDVVRIVDEYKGSFDSLSLGKPLLTTEEDFDHVVYAIGSSLVAEAHSIAGKDTAVILMGHGSEHFSNAVYSQLYLKLRLNGYQDVHVTTVEGFPSFEDTIELMKEKRYENVVLFPFMLVAGDHASNDMAGDDSDSLKCILKRHGYNVHCVIKGLGEYNEFKELFLAHLDEVICNF